MFRICFSPSRNRGGRPLPGSGLFPPAVLSSALISLLRFRLVFSFQSFTDLLLLAMSLPQELYSHGAAVQLASQLAIVPWVCLRP